MLGINRNLKNRTVVFLNDLIMREPSLPFSAFSAVIVEPVSSTPVTIPIVEA